MKSQYGLSHTIKRRRRDTTRRTKRVSRKGKQSVKRAGAMAVTGGVVATILAQNIWEYVRWGMQKAADNNIISEERIPKPLLDIINRKLSEAGRQAASTASNASGQGARWVLKQTKKGVVIAVEGVKKGGGTLKKIAEDKLYSLVEEAYQEYLGTTGTKTSTRERSPIDGSWDMVEEAEKYPKAVSSKKKPKKSKKTKKSKKKKV